MNKTDLLLQMMQQPEDYTEAEWHKLLADDECRQLYKTMAMTRSAIDADRANEAVSDGTIDDEWKRIVATDTHFRFLDSPFRKYAAMVVAILLLFGMAWAAWQWNDRSHKNATPAVAQTTVRLQTAQNRHGIVRFDNARLDSVLSVVARHYGKQVEYRSEGLRNLHFHIEWNQAASLGDFIILINNFEDVSLHEEQDTIIVEQTP